MRHWVSLILLFLLSSTTLFSQTGVFTESFDDGNLTADPAWTNHDPRHRITLDSSRYVSAPASLKISTADSGTTSLAWIETNTRIYGTRLPFEVSEKVYVESMGDEGIPFLMSGQGTSFVLFLLRNGLVELTVLKGLPWDAINLRVSNGYVLNRWIEFRVTYDGVDSTSFYIDGVYRGSIKQPLMTAPSSMTVGNPSTGHTSTFYIDDIRITRGALPPSSNPGIVRLMLCSDTGTWDGQDVNVERNQAQFRLFSDPGANSFTVMNSQFRAQLRDGRGNPLVFTWFLIGGGILSRSTSQGVEHPWIGNLETIRRYHGDVIGTIGDELAFHYHNWIWNDPDHDGVSHWNQSVRLAEYRDDFIETVGRLIIDGQQFPTAFRSGWHYMDNEWEALIDSLIPYRFENTSPDKHDDTTEPIDNVYDWSRAMRSWIPYHPSPSDYQSPGTLKGWEGHCVYMKSLYPGTMADIFTAAADGKDQFVTVWSHLPEGDFPQQILHVDSIVHEVAGYFPGIPFEYVTATEGMKEWRGIRDSTAPVITWSAARRGDSTEVAITFSEPIWQSLLPLFGRTADDRVALIQAREVTSLHWRTIFSTTRTSFTTIGLGVSDTAGNATTALLDLATAYISSAPSGLPAEFRLAAPHPNPFNGLTTIDYEVPSPSEVGITLYDMLGRQVQTVLEAHRQPGRYRLAINSSTLPSGAYLCRLTASPSGGRPSFTDTKRLLLVK